VPVTIENDLAISTPLIDKEDIAVTKRMWSIGGGKGGTGKSFVT